MLSWGGTACSGPRRGCAGRFVTSDVQRKDVIFEKRRFPLALPFFVDRARRGDPVLMDVAAIENDAEFPCGIYLVKDVDLEAADHDLSAIALLYRQIRLQKKNHSAR